MEGKNRENHPKEREKIELFNSDIGDWDIHRGVILSNGDCGLLRLNSERLSITSINKLFLFILVS